MPALNRVIMLPPISRFVKWREGLKQIWYFAPNEAILLQVLYIFWVLKTKNSNNGNTRRETKEEERGVPGVV